MKIESVKMARHGTARKCHILVPHLEYTLMPLVWILTCP